MDGIKLEEYFKLDSVGTFKFSKRQVEQQADMKTDLLLRYVFTRRDLAFDSARISTYNQWSLWSDKLIGAMLKEAKPGYKRVSITQLLDADKELFRQITKNTREGIRPNSDGTCPVDVELKRAIRDPDVCLLLQPLQGSDSCSSGASRKRGIEDEIVSPEMKEVRRLQAMVDKLQNQVKSNTNSAGSSSWGSGGKGGGKSKSKPKGEGGGKGKFVKMPKDLIGCKAEWKGKPICYAFNLKGCSVKGPECEKGVHVCSGCGSVEHGFLQNGKSCK